MLWRHTRTHRAGIYKRGNLTLKGKVQQQPTVWPSPSSRDHKSGKGRQENGHSPQLPEVCRGQLNPAFVCSLMGFPDGWLDGLAAPEKRKTTGKHPARRKASKSESPS